MCSWADSTARGSPSLDAATRMRGPLWRNTTRVRPLTTCCMESPCVGRVGRSRRSGVQRVGCRLVPFSRMWGFGGAVKQPCVLCAGVRAWLDVATWPFMAHSL